MAEYGEMEVRAPVRPATSVPLTIGAARMRSLARTGLRVSSQEPTLPVRMQSPRAGNLGHLRAEARGAAARQRFNAPHSPRWGTDSDDARPDTARSERRLLGRTMSSVRAMATMSSAGVDGSTSIGSSTAADLGQLGAVATARAQSPWDPPPIHDRSTALSRDELRTAKSTALTSLDEAHRTSKFRVFANSDA